MSIAVDAYDITKTFGAVKALDSITFEAPRAAITGFIGPDGSGKTTLFRIAATLLVPDTGNMKIFGHDTVSDYKALRKITGYMPGRFSLYQDLTVEENLKFYATVFGTTIEENYHLIREIYSHIEPFRKRLAGRLSGGMKQKLALSCALIHKPALLILDEPTTGVDAVSRREFWETLAMLKNNDITILVSTPYMDEAVKCDRIYLTQEGHILEGGDPSAIVSRFRGKIWHATAGDKLTLLRTLRQYKLTVSAEPFGGSVHVTFKDDPERADLESFLKQKGIDDFSMVAANPVIEDRFLQLMSKKSRDE
ncbi:MAG: ABC transporter ATP-binding protein [Bacteroidales bacterium]|nr:ABC transporter ATP-binding protein [Bacteroidales bacterium]